MGRPLNKKYFGTGPGMEFRVQAKIGSSSADEGFIIRQRGSKRFVVFVNEEVDTCVLVDKDLADLEAGEMTLSVRDLDDNIKRVVKISAHKATLGDGSVVGWHFAGATEDKVEIEEEADTFSDPVEPEPDPE